MGRLERIRDLGVASQVIHEPPLSLGEKLDDITQATGALDFVLQMDVACL